MGWLRDFYIRSTLAFDIAQFFSLILNKASFDSWISFFFSDYLINRQTQYVWNSFVLSFFKTNVNIEQDFVFSPILSTIYIAFIFHIFKKRTKSLLSPILISTFSFVDNRLFISQEKSYEKLNTNLFCRYDIILFIFIQFGLIIKHDKSEVLYFLRLTKNPLFIRGTYRDTSVSFSTRNYLFDIMFIIIPTKPFL